ncbi:hypothetical protein GCM10012280_55670 [Wenjunlia tyrosinilytica]|uniref:Uncharacterized protein n=1 Tax=Wenjunlia tyrosinilytica TaxID=1544741 RepID=A0A918E1J6_9ACTN|nr:hypothetical protein GCM10012280_55670 [Wenjunlia tyrosinilytica]
MDRRAKPLGARAGSVAGLVQGAPPRRPASSPSLVSQFGGFVVRYRGMAAIGVARAGQLRLAQHLLTLVWSTSLLGERVVPAVPLTAPTVLGCVAVTQRATVR